MSLSINDLIERADVFTVNNVEIHFFDSSINAVGEKNKHLILELCNDESHYIDSSLLQDIKDFGKEEPGCFTVKDTDGMDLKFKFMVTKPLCLEIEETTL